MFNLFKKKEKLEDLVLQSFDTAIELCNATLDYLEAIEKGNKELTELYEMKCNAIKDKKEIIDKKIEVMKLSQI